MGSLMPSIRFYRLSRVASAPAAQRGVVLMIALIVLVAMTLAGIALGRSIDTNSLIAGNIAFREASIHAADLGIETAYSRLAAITTVSVEVNTPAGCTNACEYYPIMRQADPTGAVTASAYNVVGVPTPFDWTSATQVTTNPTSGYDARYVIDRQCTGVLPVTNMQAQCTYEGALGGGSNKIGATPMTGVSLVYYRVTVRVVGPHNTQLFTQSVVAK
jgi:type IV pilus assembly protein PilX